MRNWLPAKLVPPTVERLEAVGLYAILRGAGLGISGAHQRIGARVATAVEARILGERRGAPLLTMALTAYDDLLRGQAGRFMLREDFEEIYLRGHAVMTFCQR